MLVVTVVGCLTSGLDAGPVAVGFAPIEYVPVYSHTAVWIGSGILLFGLVAVLVGVILAGRRNNSNGHRVRRLFGRFRGRRD